MTRKPWEGYPTHAEPGSVNLTSYRPAPVFAGGYYLFAGPHVSGERVGVNLKVRRQQLDAYRFAHPIPWRKAMRDLGITR